jgi:FKBP-type peptidyl-prolyl cis-trans isomerase SlyD
MKIKDQMVISLHYTLLIDGEELESTLDGEPITFLQGGGQIIPGLEEALYDMEVGQEGKVVIAPEDAYGIYDPDSVQVVKQEEFSEEVPLDIGTFLDLRDDEGDVLSAQVIDTDEDTVTLDFNHPLAGEELTFQVKISAIRAATEEEISHGHAH